MSRPPRRNSAETVASSPDTPESHSGKSAQRKAAAADVPSAFRRRAGIGLAAATGLMTVVSIAAAPARADTPPEAPSWVPESGSAAMAAARETGQRVKIDDATTETSEFYATPDGKITRRISASPERFSRDGAWVPIDLTLQKQADGSIAPAAYPQDMRFSGARTA